MQIIGISGKMGTGKTVLMQELNKLLPKVITVNFADILKDEVSTLFSFPYQWCYTEEGKSQLIVHPEKGKITVRELLQWYGTDVIRKNDPEHWNNKLWNNIRHTPKDSTVIIGDVRFPNEVEFIHNKEGKVIRLLPFQNWSRNDDHESETALDTYSDFWLTVAPPYGTLKQTTKFITSLLNQ